MKQKFDLRKYSDREYGMHCDTEEKAKIFIKLLDKAGLSWRTGERYDCSNWEHYEEKTVYLFNSGLYGTFQYANIFCYKILEFDDFDWEESEKQLPCKIVKLQEPTWNDENGFSSLMQKVYVRMVEQQGDAFTKAIIEDLKEQGFSKAVFLNRQWITNAILEQAKREGIEL